MPKSLFVPCITVALMLPGVAPAAMDLYGTAHLSLDVISNGDPDPAAEDTALSITSNHSHIGLRGREVLGDRVAVRWQFENTVDLDDGGWGEGRDSYVALETRIGTVLAGRHRTPYRAMTDDLDIFHETRGDYSTVLGAVDGEPVFHRRARNLLQFSTPEAYRLRLHLGYIANQGNDNLPQTADEADEDGYSVSLTFDSGPLYAGLAHEVRGQRVSEAPDDAEASRFALGWDFGQGTTTALLFEQADDGTRNGGVRQQRDAWYANVAHVAGNFTWKLALGLMDELGDTPDSGAWMTAAGFNYALSPRAELYLLAAGVFNDDAAEYGLQPYHDDIVDPGGTGDSSVVSGAIPAGVAGENAVALSGGLIYRFDIGL